MTAHPVFLPGKPQGQRSLLGHSPRGRKESDTTERLSSSEPDQHGGAAGADSRPRGRLESGDTRGSWPAGAVAGPGWRGSEVGEQFKEGGCKPRPLDATQGPRGR